VTIGTGFPIYRGGEEGLLPSVNILRFHRSTLASTIQTTFTKVSTDLIPAAPLWLRDIPEILESEIPVISDIPIMPFFTLLVMKTQGWWDHRVSPHTDFRTKEDGDVVDVEALLDHATDENVDYEEERASGRYTSEFMDKALLHAHRFVSLHGRRWKWRAIGFPM
jgi:hypothetical protein